MANQRLLRGVLEHYNAQVYDRDLGEHNTLKVSPIKLMPEKNSILVKNTLSRKGSANQLELELDLVFDIETPGFERDGLLAYEAIAKAVQDNASFRSLFGNLRLMLYTGANPCSRLTETEPSSEAELLLSASFTREGLIREHALPYVQLFKTQDLEEIGKFFPEYKQGIGKFEEGIKTRDFDALDAIDCCLELYSSKPAYLNNLRPIIKS